MIHLGPKGNFDSYLYSNRISRCTGKRLPTRHSQIVIQFCDVPHSIFSGAPVSSNTNRAANGNPIKMKTPPTQFNNVGKVLA